MDPHFDVAILGGGSAGCVLAARLSEDPSRRVLLIEAGGDLRPGAVPRHIASQYPGRAYFDPGLTWPGLAARLGTDGSNQPRPPMPYEQARILGGGSSINGIGANRGAPHDYDTWAAMGATGWGWTDVLPYFRKLEADQEFGATPLHGGDGPLPIRRIPRSAHSGFTRATEAELVRRGWAAREDQNGEWEDGVFPITVNLDDAGRRAGVATAYLTDAVRRRPNLAIWTGAHADDLVIEEGRAVRARVRRGGVTMEVAAGLFVLSAGALHSPAVLMRSGIGPGGALAALGLPVIADRPGVGRNLQEHPSTGVSGFLRAAGRLPRGEHYHIQAVLRWSSGLEGTPPGDMHLAVNSRSGWHAAGWRLGTLFGWVNRSYSTGRVTLASADPDVAPAVDFRLLSDERDLVRLAASFRLAAGVMQGGVMQAGVMQAGALRDLVPAAFASTYSARVKRLLRPGALNGAAMALAGVAMDRSPALRRRILGLANEGTPPLDALCADEALLHAHLRRTVGGVWHPCGTCRLGSPGDAMAVCDPAGRVIGVDGLVVADASVMPTVPCANLNVPVIMIAEKIAAGLRG